MPFAEWQEMQHQIKKLESMGVMQPSNSPWPSPIVLMRKKDGTVPVFVVPECLLSDRGTNMLSHLMKDICDFLRTKKLNTTGYHPQCDGMVERFNRTLITMLRKQADKI